MSAPATLPISNQAPPSSAGGAASQTPIETPAFRALAGRLSSTLRQSLSQRRPWLELLDRTAFSRPDSLSDAYGRLRRNAPYFKVNYLLLLAAVLSFSLLSHPFSLLILISLLAAWCFLYLFRPSDQPLSLLGRTFSDRETLAMLVVSTIVVIFLTSVGSLLISAVLVGVAIVCVHGAFRVPEDLFLDDPEPSANAGLLNFLGGGGPVAGIV